MRAGSDRGTWRAFIEARNLSGEGYISNFSVANLYTPDAQIFSYDEVRSVYAGIQLSF